MADIVISYRREDSEDITRAIFEHLAEHYGASRVYMDVSSIPAGVDYRKHYGSTLRKSKVLLIIIGPNWNPPQQDGRNRLDDDNDSVRNEIEVALLTDIEVIPILVKHASMPNAASLPKLLSDLPWKNAVTIESGQDFPVHMRRLVNELVRIGIRPSKHVYNFVVVILGAVAILSLVLTWWNGMAWPLWNRIVSLFLNSNTIPIPHGSSVWELEEDGSTLYLDSAGKTKKTFIFVKPSQARSNQGTMPGDVLFDGKMVGDEYDGTAYVVQGKCKGHYHANGPDGEGATTVVLRGKAPVFAATATNCQPLEGRDRDVTLTLQYRFRQ